MLNPRSCYFCHLPLRCQQKNNFLTQFFSAYSFLKLHLINTCNFSKIKSQKESQNSRNQGFSYYFCVMIEGSGSGAGSGSGSIPLTSGSGSGRPKNMWIRWIRIRIRNTTNLDPDPQQCPRGEVFFLQDTDTWVVGSTPSADRKQRVRMNTGLLVLCKKT